MAKEFDLTKLNLPVGTHEIYVKAMANGYDDSDPSNSVYYVIEPSEEPEEPETQADMIIENLYMNGDIWDNDETVLDDYGPNSSYVGLDGNTYFVYNDLELTIMVEGVTDEEGLQPPFKLKKGQKITIYPFTRDGLFYPSFSEHWTYKITIPKYVDEDETQESARGELYYNGGVRMGLNWGYLPFDIEFSVRQKDDGTFNGTIKVTEGDGQVRTQTGVDFSQGVTIEVL